MKKQLIIGLMIFFSIAGICSAGSQHDTSGYEPFTIQEGTVNGGLYWDSYYYHSFNSDQKSGKPNTVSKTFTLPSYTNIDWAMLMTTVYCGHMENLYPGWSNVTFNGIVIGNESLNVPFKKGNGNVSIVNDHANRVTSDYLMWYDVTDHIQAGDNTAIVHSEKDNSGNPSSFDGRIKLITLVVAYNDGSDKKIYYWVNRGHDTRNYLPPCCAYTNFTTDILSSTGTLQDANLFVVHHASHNGVYTFNGNNLISTPSQGEYSGSDGWTVTSYFNKNNNNTLAYNHDDFAYYKIILAMLTAEYEKEEEEEEPDLIVTAINAYHYNTSNHAIFNISNEVDVTVKNIGNATADASKVSVYANDVLIGKTDISSLSPDHDETVQLTWTPTGTDCEDGGSPVDYSLKAIADCDGVVVESDENNNESSIQSVTVYWNGFMADEPLTRELKGTIQGGLYYTTGDGYYYSKLWPSGGSQSITYNYDDIFTNVPSPDDIELARLFVYYTWSRIGNGDDAFIPIMEVSITNSTGTHIVTKAAEYNDRVCPPFSYDCYYGSHVYDITDCVKGDNTIDVTVKNVGPDGSTINDKSNFCPAAPGIVVLYKDDTKPEYDYWLVEGADLLEGGRRGGAYYLSLEECIFNATFTGSVSDTGETATLGIVSAWGGESGSTFNSYYHFNNNLLGDMSILNGYSTLYDRTVDSIHMYVGESGSAQVGVNVSDVTGDLVSANNIVTFGDDGDSMMPTNAFLLVSHTSTPGLKLSISANPTTVTIGTPIDVTFTVTNGTTPVEGADITLTGSATGNGTTDSTGTAVISVNATSKGTITATATKEGYTGDTTTLTADEEGEGVSSSVSLSVDIKPVISLVVTPNNIDFGDLSPGETSGVQTLILENKGGYDFTVTAQVSDKTEDTLFKNGLLLNSAAWGEYTAPIVAQASDTADASLNVPNDYTGIGQKQGDIMFWAEA